MFDDEVNELLADILADMQGEIFDSGEHLYPLDKPWEGESWDMWGFVELNIDNQSVGKCGM